MGDWELLQAYAKQQSETAFTELVRRHLNWVYSSARRQVGDAQAEDVTQAVFVLLARKAGGLRPGTIVAGWLFRTTRFVAARALRTQQRRKSREEAAVAMSLTAESENPWEQLVPHLDQAVAALSATDRSAILLRFYEQKSLREVGEQLGLSEEAARKRVNRAVEKLSVFMMRHGIALGGVALAGLLTEQTVQAAPATLAIAVAKASVAGVSASVILPRLVQETIRAWRLAKLKLAVIAAMAIAGIALATSILSKHEYTPAPPAGVGTTPRTAQPVSTPIAQRLQPGSIGEDPATNAAVLYRRAFAVYEALPKEQRDFIASWTNADSSVEQELCAKLLPATELCHIAVAVTNCDWGIGNLTMDSPMNYLGQARNLGRALVWHAAHCRKNDGMGVAEDIEAELRLSRTISEQAIIAHLAGLAMEAQAIDFVRMNATTFSTDVANRLLRMFDDSHAEAFARAIEAEAAMADRMAEKIPAMMSDDVRKETEAFEKDLPEYAGKFEVQKAKVVEATREIAQLHREYVQSFSFSDERYQAWHKKVDAALERDPFLKAIWPVVDTYTDKSRAGEVQWAMIAAGLAIVLNEPDALQNHADPATGKPFVYRQTPDGFELESAFQVKGKPVLFAFPNH